jgi:ubiquitin C-terminal hydrolase
MDNCAVKGKYSCKRQLKCNDKECCWLDKAVDNDDGVMNYSNNSNKKGIVCLNENHFYEATRNDCVVEFVWKVDLCGKNMFESYVDIQRHEMRNGVKYLIGVVYAYDNVNDNAIVFYAQRYEGKDDDNVDDIGFYNEMMLIKKSIYEMMNDDDNDVNNSNSNNNNVDNNRIPLLYHLMTNNDNISNDDNVNVNSTYEHINENNIKHIILPNQHIYHNQYQHLIESSLSYNISITLFSPNKNTISYTIPSITIPSKIILTSLLINNISSSSTSQTLPIIIDQTVHKTTLQSPHHIGIINAGMTCYMNSMLQSFNAINYFKRGIFSIPITTTNTNTISLSYSLQRLFFDLTFDNTPTHTNSLRHSLGWNKDDTFIQHDIHEFNLMLSSLMERELKGTSNEDVFKYLFEGTITSKIECVNYKYKSIKEETFTDLQLNVKGCNDIYESFNTYIENELLDGENKYEVEGHGKETAIKSTSFKTLPIVLILQLKRFEYKAHPEKINAHYKYYESIDLSKYISNVNANNKQQHKYQLLSVLVHKGNVYDGHYYTYIRFDITTNKWYCFNDEHVHEADVYEVFDCNYGGMLSMFTYQENNNSIMEMQSESNSSAYMLIYINTSKANEILKPITISEIPLELFKQVYKDKVNEQIQQQMQERETQMIRLYYLNETMIKNYHGISIGEGFPTISSTTLPHHKRKNNNKTLLNSFIRIPRTTTIPQLYHVFKELTGLPIEDMSLFLKTFHKPSKQFKPYFTMHFLNYSTNTTIIDTLLNYISLDKPPKWIVVFIYSTHTHQPILHHHHHHHHQQQHSQDEDAVVIDNNITIYIPKTNIYVFNTFNHMCTTFNNYKRKLLIYKTINSDNKLDVYKVLCINVDDKGGIESSSIKDMKHIESTVFDYYMKVNNISSKQKRTKKSFGIVYFGETNSMNPTITSDTPNSFEHSYPLSYNQTTFNLNFVDTSLMFLVYDFNEILYYNKESDCLIIIPVLYNDKSLIGLEKYFININ